MKNNKFFMAGMLALMLTFGLFLAGCDNGTKEPPTAKKLTITGIDITGIDITGGVVVMLVPEIGDNITPVAGGYGDISDGSVTIQLTNATQTEGGFGYGAGDWTGSGEYYLLFWQSTDGSFSGNPFRAIITEKTNFLSETTTVAWSKFQDLSL
jgi:hypothetical protein